MVAGRLVAVLLIVEEEPIAVEQKEAPVLLTIFWWDM
jgi:hypothetical protein